MNQSIIIPCSSVNGNEKKFVCSREDCKASFSKNRKLINHIRKHNGERPFACDEPGCTKTYTNSSHLRRHKNVFHDRNVQKVKCLHDGCDQIFSNKSNLKKHFNRVHNTTINPFVCSECHQSFHKKRLLNQHLFLHTGQAAFNCDKCEARFSTMAEFNHHKKNHKTYLCVCEQVFYRWTSFLEHRKACVKCKPTCSECKKIFKSNVNLKHHMLIHRETENKDVFVCTYENCKRFYFYKKNLIYHINTVHEQETTKLPCIYTGCEKLFSNMTNLKQHIQRLHGNIRKVQLPRKARKDKGISRVSTAAKLSGLKSLVPCISDITKKGVKICLSELASVNKEMKIVNENNCLKIQCNTNSVIQQSPVHSVA